MRILKFGGSTLISNNSISRVIDIIVSRAIKEKLVVVISALSGVTDDLLKLSSKAASGNIIYKKWLKILREKHLLIIKKFIKKKTQKHAEEKFIRMFRGLEESLHSIFLAKKISPRLLDFVLSFGERFAAYIISESLKSKRLKVNYLDARKLIKTNNAFGNARVNQKRTFANIRQYFKKQKGLPIITGFIGSTASGETITLGRGGSDYTASIFAAALKAEAVEFWKDVPGIMSADPKEISTASKIDRLTYKEALKLSLHRTKILHPWAIKSLMKEKIPIYIKNIFKPAERGSLVNS